MPVPCTACLCNYCQGRVYLHESSLQAIVASCPLPSLNTHTHNNRTLTFFNIWRCTCGQSIQVLSGGTTSPSDPTTCLSRSVRQHHPLPFHTPPILPPLPLTPPSPQSTIDGDLCELFNSLDTSKKREIAEDLDRTPNEVCYWSYQLL